MTSNATVVRVRPLGTDEYGDPIQGEADRAAIDGSTVSPRFSRDLDNRGRQGVIEGLRLYAPYGTEVLPTDRFEVDGVLYEVDGEAGKWKSPFDGWQAGVEVDLKRAIG